MPRARYAYLGESNRALEALAGAVRCGYFGLWHGQHDVWFDTIRGNAAFAHLVEESRKGHDAAFAAFQKGNGDAILRSLDL